MLDGETLAHRMAARLAAVCDPVLEVGRGVSGLPSRDRAARRLGAARRARGGRATPCGSGEWSPPRCSWPSISRVSAFRVLELLRDWPGAPTAVPEAGGRLQPVCARYGPDALLAAGSLVIGGVRSLHVLLDVVDYDVVPEAVWRSIASGGHLRRRRHSRATPSGWASTSRGYRDRCECSVWSGGAARRAVTSVRVRTIDGDRVLDKPDKLVTEEPMEIRVHGPGQEPRPLAITMRTPGNDFELAVGFCLTEGILEGADDLATVAYCLAGEGEQEYNVVTVALRDGRALTHPSADSSPTPVVACAARRRSTRSNSTATRWPTRRPSGSRW